MIAQLNHELLKRQSPVSPASEIPATLSVSVVVPCRNEARAIQRFVDSFLQQDLERIDWEIVIADGLSDDGTRQQLQTLSAGNPRIRVIDNPLRTTPAGLNAAIRAARSDVLLRMDVHTEYRRDYIRRSLELLAKTGAASVGGACIARGSGYVGRAIAAAFHSGFAVGGARWHRPNHEGPSDTIHLGCWRREVLEQAGLFDESLVRNQDDELNLRLRRAGGVLWQSPEIVAWYSPRSSLHALAKQYFQYGFWRVAVIRKHRLPGAWRQIAPAAFVLANLLALMAIVLGEILGVAKFPAVSAAVAITDAVYLIASLGAAFLAARKHGWTLFWVLPIVFAAYHLSYGLGFLFGIFYFAAKSRPPISREGFCAGLSR